MDTLKQLSKIADAIDKRPEMIKQARADGATWEQIAEALRMSRAGAIKLHNTARGR